MLQTTPLDRSLHRPSRHLARPRLMMSYEAMSRYGPQRCTAVALSPVSVPHLKHADKRLQGKPHPQRGVLSYLTRSAPRPRPRSRPRKLSPPPLSQPSCPAGRLRSPPFFQFPPRGSMPMWTGGGHSQATSDGFGGLWRQTSLQGIYIMQRRPIDSVPHFTPCRSDWRRAAVYRFSESYHEGGMGMNA